MPAARLAEIVKYCDRLLLTPEVKDYDGALNGLQVENSGTVTLGCSGQRASHGRARITGCCAVS
jgi:hypothetical protein